MTDPVAIVGMACEYPDARSPEELWENVVAQRQAFRRLPAERLRLEDYPSADGRLGLGSYTGQAAVLEGYTFDRERFRIAGSAFRTVDLSHWLALDCADRALRDAGFPDGTGLPASTTGVLIGNTLTGDYSRAAALQLRWPYVHASVAQGLEACGLTPAEHPNLLPSIRSAFLSHLPDLNAETLAGWLSNTIAGRICNYFDLKGGGYVVDGACASSLLAIASACTALRSGDVDVAIAGGVDLSIDPFELVGFARAGALSGDEMRPYDRRASGFWPGEGCGIVVLMRASDAHAQRRPVYARLLGWGVSSDGHGGITRPELDGQLHAIRRAYGRASVSIDSVGLFEGHGTGTPTGDEVELQALEAALAEANTPPGHAAVGSIKANIGHTKAAAGIAGLIKAVMSIRTGLLPPATACGTPAAPLDGSGALRILQRAEPWPGDRPRTAGVSAMGFGGINVHVVLQDDDAAAARRVVTRAESAWTAGQDVEFVPLAASGARDMRRQISMLRDWAAAASRAELTDLAVERQRSAPSGALRAAFVARTPAALVAQCDELLRTPLDSPRVLDPARGVFAATGTAPTIALLCSGQGSPKPSSGGRWSVRFADVRELYARPAETARTGQESIVLASIAALRVLARCGIRAQAAVGHSLGELTAMHWAAVLDEHALLRLVHERAMTMERYGRRDGTMAAIAADAETARACIDGDGAVVACLNGPTQTVLSGDRDAVARAMARAGEAGLGSWPVKVPQAFHSPHMAAATAPFGRVAEGVAFAAPSGAVYSTVLGRRIGGNDSIPKLLRQQLTDPVRFAECITAAGAVDLWIEAGPGDVLASLVREQFRRPAVALDACGDSLAGWLNSVAAAYVLGAPISWDELTANRFSKPIDPDRIPQFLKSPCGSVRTLDPVLSRTDDDAVRAPAAARATRDPLEIARSLIAERTELPVESIQPHHRLLSDLHLNSMAVGVIASDLSRALELQAQVSPGPDSTVKDLVDSLAARGDAPPVDDYAGVAAWVRPFRVEYRPSAANHPVAPPRRHGAVVVSGDADHLCRAAAEAALRDAGGGVLVFVPADPTAESLLPLLAAARRAASAREPQRFVVIHRNGGARGLCRTLAIEAPQHNVLVASIAPGHPSPETALFEEISRTAGFREVRIGAGDERLVPHAVVAELRKSEPLLRPGDVVLVTGGARGISAECGLALARSAGARLALVGRSNGTSEQVRVMLDRCRALGVEAAYEAADVRDRDALAEAVKRLRRALGPIAFVLHGAGINEPTLLHELDDASFLATATTKVDGAMNLIASIDRDALRGFVAFGSVIAHAGLRGEAHYAAANELLAAVVDRASVELPHCRCLTIDWSVWSGAGMGERLNRIAALERDGVAPITIDRGVDLFLELANSAPGLTDVIATGRLGTSWLSADAAPFGRFLERPRVHVGGVEIVADADVSASSDPYLDDHRLDGVRVLPGVMSLEAMAQAATALTPDTASGVFELRRVTFDHPVTADGDDAVGLRVAALVNDDGVVMAVRSSQTGFGVDHVRGTFVRDPAAPPGIMPAEETGARGDIHDASEFYGSVFFHGPRFRRVRRYRALSARNAIAEIESNADDRWFGSYLPQRLVLGDPGARDATIHAIQACIPDSRLVPTGIECLWIRSGAAGAVRVVRAVERWQRGSVFMYDAIVTDEDGNTCEMWQGLELKAIAPLTPPDGWPVALLGPLVERMVPEDAAIRVLAAACLDRSGAGRALLRRLVGVPVTQRGDGRPEVAAGHVSAAHGGGVGLAVSSPAPVACDVEPIVARTPDTWRRLLGRPIFALAQACADADGLDAAATRLWCARECLHKLDRKLSAAEVREVADRTVVFHCGDVSVITRHVPLHPGNRHFVVALATAEAPARTNRSAPRPKAVEVMS